MEPNNQKNELFDKVMAWAKKDALVIIVMIFALGACLYTLYTVGNYQKAINLAWTEQWEQSGCAFKPYQPNITFNYGGYYGNQDRD